jgi:hypothetical protein
MLNKGQIASMVMIVFVWGFAGALFGALFAGLYQVLSAVGLMDWRQLVYASAIAAMTTAAFYSAMPVALVGATAGVLASIGHLIATGQQVELSAIVGLSGLAGVFSGGFYDWVVKQDGRPFAEALAGLLAGLLAGIVLALVLAATERQATMAVLAAGVVALVGSIYQIAGRWLVGPTAKWFPGELSTPLLAALIAVVVGASIWILEVTSGARLGVNALGSMLPLLTAVPQGLLGGLAGGVLTGLLLELTGFRLEDHG